MRCVIEVRRAIAFSTAAVFAVSPLASWPQAFPSKPVRYVVPFGPGGSPDIVGRLLADRLSRLWGQQVVIDNRVGGAGVLGTAYVAKSTPDGHTLVQCNIASSGIAVSLYKSVPYDQVRDIAPVTRIGMTPNIVTVHPSLPIRSFPELISYAKANPSKLSYSSGLVGTSPQLSMELVKLIANIDMVNIPYKIGAQGIGDTVAGQVPVNISNFPAITSQIRSGRLRPLAVTSATRAAQFPDIPTIQESGLPDFDVQSWYGVCAPASTPSAILDKLHDDFGTVLRMPDVEQKMTELMMPPAPTSRDKFDQFIRGEIARWARVIKEAGIPQQ